MSGSYGGFVSRGLEMTYNKTVFAMLYLLQKIIIYHQGVAVKTDADDLAAMKKVFTKMVLLETQKHSQPKFTRALKTVVNFFALYESVDPNTTVSIGSIDVSDINNSIEHSPSPLHMIEESHEKEET
jgi:hypothetical protein